MFFDTAHNGRHTAAANVARAAAVAALKLWAYLRCLQRARVLISPALVTRALAALADAACYMTQRRARGERYPRYACTLTRASVTWLVLAACRRTLATDGQSASAEVRAWLDQKLACLARRKLSEPAMLSRAVKDAVGIP